MHDRLVGLLDKADAAVAHSAGVLEPAMVEALAARADDTRARLSYPETVVVAALAGGTGSGKSSLLNAVAGQDVSLTGAIRPMTSEPLALVPQGADRELGGYLDQLEITDRVSYVGPEWLCLIDLPDNDSVEVSHRHKVDALLPRVDVVAWVTDPEKYRDASLHLGYIRQLARYQDQFLFVLNQIDRLAREDLPSVAADLREALEQDGISDPEIVLVAADPAAGPPTGIDDFLESLDAALDRRQAVHRKALADLAGVAEVLVQSSSGARAIDFEGTWADQVSSAVALAHEGKAAGGAHDIAEYLSRLASEMGGETENRLLELAVDSHNEFLRCVESGTPVPQGRSWTWMRRRGGEVSRMDHDALAAMVDTEIGDRVRALLVQRGRAHAAITDLALALHDVAGKTA
jgi:GTP-binding protein EngB required for normal cell division